MWGCSPCGMWWGVSLVGRICLVGLSVGFEVPGLWDWMQSNLVPNLKIGDIEIRLTAFSDDSTFFVRDKQSIE